MSTRETANSDLSAVFPNGKSIRRGKKPRGGAGRKEITRPLSARPDDKRFRRRREIRFLVSGSQPARICHAPTNLPSTSSILGHLGSTGNYNIGLLDEEFEVAAERGRVLGTLTRAKASGAQADGGAPPA